MNTDNNTFGPVVLIIRDGWGENPDPTHDSFNAVKLAKTPVADQLTRNYPQTLIKTCGEDVGLPPGIMGNSEVGHQNIGAGRVVDQELMRITNSIHDGSFYENPALLGAIQHAQTNNSNLHIMGLVSNGCVHSDIEHLFALIDLIKKVDFPGERVFIHAFTDGRDTGPKTGLGFIQQLEAKLKETGVGSIASVIGRYYAMDRDHRWGRVALAYATMTMRNTSLLPNGPKNFLANTSDATEPLSQHYDNPRDTNCQGDEFVPASLIGEPKKIGDTRISDNDSVIFFNFRGDRPRELTRAFIFNDEEWKNVQSGGFNRGERINNLYFCTMSEYEKGLPVTATAFKKPPKMLNILGDVLSTTGLTQFRCAETEKFAHVTFFFNDYREEPFTGETRLLCQSPKDVSTYDQKPQMSAHDICAGVLERLQSTDCEALIIVNFANPDMVGHTGNLDAAVKAVETVDACVGELVEATVAAGGSLLIIADHGNAEQMWNTQADAPHTAHTTNDVPCLLVGKVYSDSKLRIGGRLADIAPTILEMLQLDQPREMTGHTLIEPRS